MNIWEIDDPWFDPWTYIPQIDEGRQKLENDFFAAIDHIKSLSDRGLENSIIEEMYKHAHEVYKKGKEELNRA